MLKPVILSTLALSVGIVAVVLVTQYSKQPVAVDQASITEQLSIPTVNQTISKEKINSQTESSYVQAESVVIDPSDLKLPTEKFDSEPSDDSLEPQTVWIVDTNNPVVEEGGIHVAHVNVEPGIFEKISLGQTLVLELPHIKETYQAKITSTHNTLDGIEVWQGQIENGQSFENVSISRGVHQTYITVSTANGAYSVEVDNQTGEATITDDSEITFKKEQGGTDVVIPEEPEIVPPSI